MQLTVLSSSIIILFIKILFFSEPVDTGERGSTLLCSRGFQSIKRLGSKKVTSRDRRSGRWSVATLGTSGGNFGKIDRETWPPAAQMHARPITRGSQLSPTTQLMTSDHRHK